MCLILNCYLLGYWPVRSIYDWPEGLRRRMIVKFHQLQRRRKKTNQKCSIVTLYAIWIGTGIFHLPFDSVYVKTPLREWPLGGWAIFFWARNNFLGSGCAGIFFTVIAQPSPLKIVVHLLALSLTSSLFGTMIFWINPLSMNLFLPYTKCTKLSTFQCSCEHKCDKICKYTKVPALRRKSGLLSWESTYRRFASAK